MLEEMLEFIANRIQTLRANKNISARDMSLSLGQNPGYIGKIENKQAKPSLEGLILICEFFNMTLEEFFSTGVNHPDKVKELLNEVSSLDISSLSLLIDTAKKINHKK